MIFNWIFIIEILLVFISASGISLALWVYFADRKNKVNQIFFGLILSAVVWISLDYATSFPNLFPYALWMARIEWAIVAIFLIFAYFFSIYFPKESKRYPVLDITVVGIEIVFFFLSLFTDTIIKGIEPLQVGVRYVLGTGGIIDLITIIPLVIIMIFNIFKKYFTLSQLEKLRVQYFLIGLSIWVGANLIFNVGFILFVEEHPPTLSYLGTSSAIFFFIFTAYAIVKHQLFGIKVILTQILVGVMGLVLLILPFIVKTTLPMKILMGGVFLTHCFIGYLLVKSTLREVRQKEILEEKVKERTKKLKESKEKIERAYKEIKKRKEELEKFYKLTVGRELKMIELKEKIKELEKKIKEKD